MHAHLPMIGNVGIGTTSPAYTLAMGFSGSGWGGTQIGFCVAVGCLPGYPSTLYPTIKTDGSDIGFAVGGSYAGYVSTGGFNNVSSRKLKTNITPLDYADVLKRVDEMEVLQWNYKANPADLKHIGPMAEDFHALFGLNGTDSETIATTDEMGVTLAALKGLSKKLKGLESELAMAEKENSELKKVLCEMKPEAKLCDSK